MNVCRFCGKELANNEVVCSGCGYDPKTDTIKPEFRQQGMLEKKSKKGYGKQQGHRQGVSPWVKKFAFIGLAVVIFSIFYKYNFRVDLVTAEVKYIFTLIRTGKITQLFKGPDKDKNKIIELFDVRSFKKSPKDSKTYRGLVIEGIFYDSKTGGFVVINGEVVPNGESFKGAKVMRINRHSVELLIDGKVEILETNQSTPFPKNR